MKKIYVVYGVNNAGAVDGVGNYVATFRYLAEFKDNGCDGMDAAAAFIEICSGYDYYKIDIQFTKN